MFVQMSFKTNTSAKKGKRERLNCVSELQPLLLLIKYYGPPKLALSPPSTGNHKNVKHNTKATRQKNSYKTKQTEETDVVGITCMLRVERWETGFWPCFWPCRWRRRIRFGATVFDTSRISTSLKDHTPKTKKGFLALYSYTAACREEEKEKVQEKLYSWRKNCFLTRHFCPSREAWWHLLTYNS